jgi:nicotinate-nucleotide adenylyltransferase
MTIGLYGGTFDPPHLGHLVLAEFAMDALRLDSLIFIPAWHSPFKADTASAPAAHRAEMLRLALSDQPRYELSLCELEREGPSYTADTVHAMRSRHPGATLLLLMGADAFADFPLWNNPEAIVADATLAVAQRSGFPLDLASHPFGAHARVFDMPRIDISSTLIRERVRARRSVASLLPWSVRVYIDAQRLYRRAT